MKTTLIFILTLFLSGCYSDEYNLPANGKLEEYVQSHYYQKLREHDIRNITVKCDVIVIGPVGSTKFITVASYENRYGEQTFNLNLPCRSGQKLIEIVYTTSARYSPASYQVSTAKDYEPAIIQTVIQTVLDHSTKQRQQL